MIARASSPGLDLPAVSGVAPPVRSARPVPPRRARMAARAGGAFRALERLFVVASLFFLSGALLPLLREAGGAASDAEAGDPVQRGVFLLVYAVAAAALLLRPGRALEAARRHLPTLALVGLALASVLWSAAPELTLRRGGALLGTTLFGVYLATRFHQRELLALLAWALGASAAVSVALALGVPELGIMSGMHEGAWRGAFPHKNGLGRAMALGAVLLLLAARAVRGPARTAAYCGVAAAAVLVFLSDSASALVVLAALVLLLPLYRSLRGRHPARVLLLLGAAFVGTAAAAGLASAPEAAVAALGRDATLTGRTTLWAAVAEAVGERSWLGYGYASFWSAAPESEALFRAVGWEPRDAHNGFLDLWVHLGFTGLVLFLAGYGVALRRGLSELAAGGEGALWPVAFLTFFLVGNLAESSILEQNDLYWALYVAVVVRASAIRGRTPRIAPDASPPPALSPGVRLRARRARPRSSTAERLR